MNVTFTKMSGAGNDFIVIDNMNASLRLSETGIRALCTRRTGIGADGLIMIEPSDRYDFVMKYYNADGRLGSMCGNGGRCAVHFAWSVGACTRHTTFEANGNRYEAVITGDETVRLKMTAPTDFRDRFDANGYSCYYINTGSPHAIVYLDSTDTFDVDTSGRAIRSNRELFPDGTNVNFIEITSSSSLKLRTFERGVEAETLACGTGAVASALVSYRLGKITAERVDVTVHSGDILTIDFSQDMNEVFLSGPARVVYTGTVAVN